MVQVAFVAFAVPPGSTVPIGQLQAGYLRHGPVAQFVLEHAPELYSPEPDTFVERTLGTEVSDFGSVLPVVYTSSGGTVKALARESDIPDLAARLGTTTDALGATARSAHRPDLVYLVFSEGVSLEQ
ncbi:MAG: hypothetical protein Q8K99_14645 [Actinomycetota bacterium]|nr:hypothetical protein [Actinomycetota bacterium]